jgi:hypothetical protein
LEILIAARDTPKPLSLICVITPKPLSLICVITPKAFAHLRDNAEGVG